eukprot:gene1388-2673_t
MGAGPSIVLNEDPLSLDYELVRKEVWGGNIESNNNARRRGSQRPITIRSLASQQLSNVIETNRNKAPRSFLSFNESPAPSITKSDVHYSKSVQIISSAPHVDFQEQHHKKRVSIKQNALPTVISDAESHEMISWKNNDEEDSRHPDESASSVLSPVAMKSAIRKKPNLIISMQSDDANPPPENDSFNGSPLVPGLTLPQLSNTPKNRRTSKDNKDSDENLEGLMFRRKAKFLKMRSSDLNEAASSDVTQELTPDAGSKNSSKPTIDSTIVLSPGGSTAFVGNWKIKDTGLMRSPRLGDQIYEQRVKCSDAYLEIGALGTGASGTVVEALHLPTLTIVALKVLPVHNPKKNHYLSQELAVLYKNLTELKLVDEDSLTEHEFTDHPSKSHCHHVLSMYDAFIDTRACKINLVMEVMDGGSLQDLVQNGGTKDEHVLADIAYQVIKGLQYLHTQHQMHRDIKPGNILLNSKGWIKVADFGISKAMDNTFGCAKSFVGTMCYMAPERIEAKNYGFPADIWSMGLTILAVSRGCFPLPEQTEGFWGLLSIIVDGEPPTAGPEFSDKFNDFIAVCLRKDPTLRGTPAQLLKHPFLDEFRERRSRGSINFPDPLLNNSDSAEQMYPPSRPDVAELKSPSVSLSKIAATKSGGAEEEDIFNIRLAHLVQITEILQLRCIQRESGDLAEGNEDGECEGESFEFDDDYDELQTSHIPRQPIRLPSLSGKSAFKWKHLANQLHLPFETVRTHVRRSVDERFFLEDTDE